MIEEDYTGSSCGSIIVTQTIKAIGLCPTVVVEPLIQDSQFVGTGRHKSGVLSFSDLFDIDHFNKLTTKRSGCAQLSKVSGMILYKSHVIVRGSTNDPL